MNGHVKRIIITGMLLCGFLGALILISGWAKAESTLPSTTITVNTLEDEPGTPGNCSLREAIASAADNVATDACPAGSDASADTIEFSVNGTIQLTAPLVVEAGGPLLIDGGGTITLSGQSATRVFTTTLDADLTLESLVVTLGAASHANGAGIYNTGSLVLSDTTITTNTAYTYGGGIYNLGQLSIANSAITGNIVNGELCGGGIHNEGTLSITDSILTNNSAQSCGGGVSNHNGSVTITGSIISENHAGGDGGGISNYMGTIYLADDTLHGNSTDWGDGGAIYNNDGDLTVISTTISDNLGDLGGGIYSWLPTTSISSTVLILNSALSGNIGFEGGGIYNANPSQIDLINSTLSGNTGDWWGGGIYNSDIMTITNATIAGNNVISGYGGGIYTGNLRTTNVQNSIIANNTAMAYGGKDCEGPITSDGFNIFGNLVECIVDITTGDIVGMNPKLGSLQDNGGPTYTQALLSGSLAIDHGGPTGCKDDHGAPLTIDQRGYPRDDRCDIGAFEVQTVSGPYRTFLPCVSRSCTPFYFDGFDNPGSGWYSGVNDFVQYEYLNQEYRILLLQPHVWAASWSSVGGSDFVAQVDVRNQADIDGSSGILFGIASASPQFYSFEISPTFGTYGIYRYGQYGMSILAEGFSDSILPYPASNHLEFERKGGQIWVFVNGQLLNVINETYYISSGYFGLIAASTDQANYDARFDDFTLYPISCGQAGSYQSTTFDTPIYEVSQVNQNNHQEGVLERKSFNR